MKKNFLFRVVWLLAGFGLAFASCSDSDTDSADGTPAFPTPVTTNIAPGAQYSLTIEPNMDWEAKIPNEVATDFWFLDKGHIAYTLHGSAGKTTLTVVASELENFDGDRVCEVSLTMGGQTQVIATLTIANQERTITIHTALPDPDPKESGSLFLRDEESGEYKYAADAVETFAMVSHEGEYNYMQRLLIESNFEWAIGKYPDWMILDNTKGSAGKTELFIRTDSEKCPWEDIAASLVFIDASDTNNPVEVDDIKVGMTGCGDRVFTGLAAEEVFNAAGAYYNATQGSYGSPDYGTTKNFELAYGSQVALVVEDAGGKLSVGNDASWIRFVKAIEWEEAAKTAGLWSHNLQILCASNTGKARKAYVVAIPRAQVPEGFDPADLVAGQQIAQAYRPFVVSTITQSAAAGEFIKVETFDGSDEFYTFTQLPGGDWPLVDAWSSAPVAYNLTYKTAFAYEMAPMEFSTPYKSAEYYSLEEGPSATAQISPLWLGLEPSAWEKGKEWVKLKGSYDYDNMIFTWADGLKPEMPGAYIVFKDEAGQILGIVEFMYIHEDKGEEDDVKVSLAAPIDGVTLAPITAGDGDFDPEMECPQYKLTVTKTLTGPIALNLPENDSSTYFDDDVVYFYSNGNNYALQLFFQEAGRTEIILKNNYMIIGRILVVYQPE